MRSRDTLHLLPPLKRAGYERLYRLTGLMMIASPAAAVALSFVFDDPGSPMRTVIFWVEAFGVWSFAAYWAIKTREMRESSAERRALDAELKRDTAPVERVVPAEAAATTK